MARRNEYVIYNVANIRTYVHIYVRTDLSDKTNGVQKPKINYFFNNILLRKLCNQ